MHVKKIISPTKRENWSFELMSSWPLYQPIIVIQEFWLESFDGSHWITDDEGYWDLFSDSTLPNPPSKDLVDLMIEEVKNKWLSNSNGIEVRFRD